MRVEPLMFRPSEPDQEAQMSSNSAGASSHLFFSSYFHLLWLGINRRLRLGWRCDAYE